MVFFLRNLVLGKTIVNWFSELFKDFSILGLNHKIGCFQSLLTPFLEFFKDFSIFGPNCKNKVFTKTLLPNYLDFLPSNMHKSGKEGEFTVASCPPHTLPSEPFLIGQKHRLMPI